MINRIFEALATFSDVAYMVWFIPAFLHVSRLRDIKPYIYAVPALMLAFEYSADLLLPGFDLLYLAGSIAFITIFAVMINMGRKSKFRALLAACIFTAVQMFSSSLVYAGLSFAVGDMDTVMQGESGVPRIIYLIVCFASRFVIYKLILSAFSYNDPLDRKNGVTVSLYTFISVIALGFLMKLAVENESVNDIDILALLLSVVAATLVSYFMVYQVQVSQRREYEYKLLAERASFAQTSADDARFIWDNIRKVRHDLKNHLSVVSAKLNSGDTDGCNEYINTLTETVNSFGNIISTNNSVIDYLINSKLSRQDKIKITVFGYVGDYSDIDDADLACILGNVIDNAVEAEQKIDEENRRIELHFLSRNQTRIIVCKNTISESVLKSNPKLRTTKGDAGGHGLGHKIVRETAEKYYGFVNYSEEDGMFCVQILLPQRS